jgi:hypothetical protein
MTAVCISHNHNFIIKYIVYDYDDHIYSMEEFEPNWCCIYLSLIVLNIFIGVNWSVLNDACCNTLFNNPAECVLH